MTARGYPNFTVLTLTLVLCGCSWNEDVNAPQATAAPPTNVPASTEPTITDESLTACENPRPELCTQDYNPVCAQIDTGVRCIRAPCPEASDWKTYSNACIACSDDIVMGYKMGECRTIL